LYCSHPSRSPPSFPTRRSSDLVYDEPEFIVRNLWRLYGGWYDGNPAHLKPAPEGALAAELARLAGGAGPLADRAAALAAEGDLRSEEHTSELQSRGHLVCRLLL